MDVGDYYSKSFNDFKENLNIAVPALVGIVLMIVIIFVAVLIGIFGAYFGSFNTDLASPNLTIVVLLFLIIAIAVIIGLLVGSFIYAATIGMAKKIIEGKKPGLDVAWKYGKKYFLKILALVIIMYILYFLLAIPALIGFILLNISSAIGWIVILIGVLILIAGGLFVVLALLVANQSIIVGEKSIISAIKESYKLFMKNKLQIFLVALINFVIGVVVGLLGFIPYIGSILNILAEIVLIPYLALVITYLYMDLKGMLPLNEY
jgi:hypothetical protein